MSLESSRSSDDPSAVQVPDLIPIFPLPNVVLFPRTYLPLHIFEPRYRTMVADAMQESQCIGMVLLKEGWEANYAGNPPIYRLGCIGRLASVQPLPDGRYNIILEGLGRFDITEEHYQRPYRQARIEMKPEQDGSIESGLRAELLSLLDVYGAAGLETGQSDTRTSDTALVHALAVSLNFTPLEKQLLLEADSLTQRARRLYDLLQLRGSEHRGLKRWT